MNGSVARWRAFSESGLYAPRGVAQALHRGPYDKEPEALARMDALMEQQNLTMSGRHHEIYLTPVTEQLPPRQIEAILRHPVRPLDR